MSDSCNGSKCIVSCSCNSANGWYDTPSSYSARAASAYGSVTKTSSRKYADLGNKTKSCTHNCSCSTSSSTSCPTDYSTGTTSCASGQYFVSTSCTTTTTYDCSPSGCSYNNTYTYPEGGKCNNCTYYKSNETCPQGYTLGKTSCDAGYSLTQTSSTITNTRNYGSATECPTYTSSAANRCGKCTQNCYFTEKRVEDCPPGYRISSAAAGVNQSTGKCSNGKLPSTVEGQLIIEYTSTTPGCKKEAEGFPMTCHRCKASYYSLQVHVSFSAGTGLSIQNNNTSAKITVNGESKTVTPTSAFAVFSNLPAGTYTVSGSATIAVREAAGDMYFCRFSTDSQLSDSKTVTIPSTISTSLSFSCYTEWNDHLF